MFKKLILLIIVAAGILNINAPGAGANSLVDYLFEVANEYYQRGDFENALHELNKLLLIAPEHPQAEELIKQITCAQMERENEAQIGSCLDAAEEAFTATEAERAKEEAKIAKRKTIASVLDEVEEKLTKSQQEVVQEPAEILTQREEEIVQTKLDQSEAEDKGKKEPPPLLETEEIPSQWIFQTKPKELITSELLRDHRLFKEAEVFIAGQRQEIEPVIIRDEDIWLPLERVAAAFGWSEFTPEENALMVISEEGLPLEFNIGKHEVLVNKRPFLIMPQPLAIYNGNVMLSLNSLQKALGLSCEYFPDTHALKISKVKKAEFSTFTIAKPKEIIAEEKLRLAEAAKVEYELPRQMKAEILPAEFYPDIDLRLDANFRYFHDMLETRRTRYTEYYLNGRMYDLDVFGHLSMRDYETNLKRTFKEDAQHLSFFKDKTAVKLLDNYLRLPQVRSQSQSYWGVEIDNELTPLRYSTFIGEMEPVYVSALEGGRSVKYFGRLYGLSQDWVKSEQFRLSAVELFTESASEFSEDSGASNYPRRNLVYLLDSAWQLWPELKLSNTFAQSIYAPDNKPDVLASDYDVKTGIQFDRQRYGLHSYVEYVGDRYASLGMPSSYQDFLGWNMDTNFKLLDNLTLYISGDINRNNVAFDEAHPSAHTRGVSTSANMALPYRQNLNLGWAYNRYLTRGGGQDATGNEYDNYNIDYFKSWDSASLQLGWQHYKMDPLATSSGSMFFDTYSATVYKNFASSYIMLYQDMTKRKETASPSTTTLNSTLSGRYYLLPELSLSGNCKVVSTLQDELEDTAIMSVSTGAEYNLSKDTTLSFTYEVGNIDLTEKWSTDDWSILLYIRHIFDLHTPEKWGRVLVTLFEDTNANNTKDIDEEGLEGVLAYVVQGQGARTDVDGMALIENVVPGKRQLRLELNDLPLDMIIKGEPIKEIMVEPLKTAHITFIAVTAGTIKGRVFVDMNNNGIFDKGVDIPIADAHLSLTPEYRDTLSFSDGSYQFEYAYPGRGKISISREGIAEEYKLVSPEAQEVEVGPKETLENIDFIFRGRPLKIKFF